MSLDNPATNEKLFFTLDGKRVEATKGETIWQVAKRYGVTIPHLCWKDSPGYRADGNCRACMVEIEGERVLAASCIRIPSEGMSVTSQGERVNSNRKIVFDLLASDMPIKEQSPDPEAHFWTQAKNAYFESPSFPSSKPGAKNEIPVDSIFRDASHPSIAVNLDVCIACGLCERACKEVQVNDVIGMAKRGIDTSPVFDIEDPMGASSCVACGECVQACPTGALMEKSLMNAESTKRIAYPEKKIESVCPFCGVGCRTEVSVKENRIIKVDGIQGPANRGKLCVKGRFGMDYVMHPERLTKPLIRRPGIEKEPDCSYDFSDINKILKQHRKMSDMMKKLSKKGMGSIDPNILGGQLGAGIPNDFFKNKF